MKNQFNRLQSEDINLENRDCGRLRNATDNSEFQQVVKVNLCKTLRDLLKNYNVNNIRII